MKLLVIQVVTGKCEEKCDLLNFASLRCLACAHEVAIATTLLNHFLIAGCLVL